MEGGQDANKTTYYDISHLGENDVQFITLLQNIAVVKKQSYDGNIGIGPMPFLVGNQYLAIGINFDEKVKLPISTDFITIKDVLVEQGFYEETIALPELTEEQFYNTTA